MLDEHCDAVGRDPGEIEKAANVGIAIRDGDLEAQFGAMAQLRDAGRAARAACSEMVDRVGAYGEAGADWVILAMRAPFDVDGLDMFASEVLPQLTGERASVR